MRESCEVDITNDDVFMNTRCVHLWPSVYVACLCSTGVCLVKNASNILLTDLKILSNWWSRIAVEVAVWTLNMTQ